MAAHIILAVMYRLTFEDYVTDHANIVVSGLFPSVHMYWNQAKGQKQASGHGASGSRDLQS